ncbi:efflux RND transporter periplasmic adaptor subunit [Enterobacteriaceae bacterium 4M9]|nr:efflux RND transporter periplasmic adaptor subunit [Enterobacteriaceae bacterium 4M9]
MAVYQRIVRWGWAAAIGLGVLGCDDTQQAPSALPPEVETLLLVPEPVTLTRDLQGRTVAPEIAQIRPQVNGIVEKKLFTEGAMVKAGQPLFLLQKEVYQTALDQAEADLKQTQAARLAARLQYQRAQQLIGKNYISKQDYDNLRATLQQADSSVAASEAAVQAAQINLRYTTITSPIDGQIGRSSITVGALLTANQETVLVTVRRLDPMYVDMTQSGDDFLALRRAVDDGSIAPVNIITHLLLQDGTQYEYVGKLQFADVAVDESTGAVSLRAAYPNPERYLLPGMFVRTRVEIGRRDKGILIPQQAVQRTATGAPVAMVVDNNSKVRSVSLVLNRSVGNSWLVDKGLAGGERLIINGPGGLREGSEVRISALSSQGGS